MTNEDNEYAMSVAKEMAYDFQDELIHNIYERLNSEMPDLEGEERYKVADTIVNETYAILKG